MKVKITTLYAICVTLIVSFFSLQISASAAVEYKKLTSGFEITVSAPASGDFYQLWVGKLGKTEENIENISSEADFLRDIGYVDFATAKNTNDILFSVDLSGTDDYGYYTAVLIKSGAGGELNRNYYVYKLQNPDLENLAIQDFMDVETAEGFVDTLETYSAVPNDLFGIADLDIFADEAVASQAGAYFAITRDLIYDAGSTFSGSVDILDCAYAAYTLSELFGNNVADAKYAVEHYGSFIAEYLPSKEYTETFMKLLSVGKPHISDSEALGKILSVANASVTKVNSNSLSIFENLSSEVKCADDFEIVVKWSTALGGLVDATRAEIEKVISDNDDLFGIDTSADAHYGVTLAQVAHRFDTTKVNTLYGQQAFGEYYDSIAKAIADEEEQKREDSENKKENNHGGGSGGKISVNVEPVENPAVDTKTDLETSPVEPLPFKDISGCTWAHEHIKALYDKGVINGIDDEHFEPDRPVTRAEFVKMLVTAFNVTGDVNIQFEFYDVSRDLWCYPYMETAYRAGIVNGMSKNYFGISETITRQDAAVMLARIIGFEGTTKPQFKDTDEVADYALKAVSAVSELGIMTGTGSGAFEPGHFTTRAQAATIIARAMKEVQ